MGKIASGLSMGAKAAGKSAKAATKETTKEVPAVVKKRAKPGQTVSDPERMAFPGIYKRPDIIAQEAASMVAPESPSMKELFGVTRDELYDISKELRGNLPGELPGAAAKPRGSEAAEKVMTRKNTQRLLDVLSEVERFPELMKGMDSWYTMIPLYQKAVEVLGAERAKAEYPIMNALMGMASPGSAVTTEIPRGTAAYYLHKQGRFPEFMSELGKPVGLRNPGLDPEILGVPGHPYHKTAQGLPMQRFLETGEMQMESPKVPMYIEASGVPETGFQTRTPVGDAHFVRGVGLADVRTNKGFAGSITTPEMTSIAPWWREQVAGQLGIESVPAQARTWGAFAPQTGVDTPIGAPKLELIADDIMRAARRLNISPIEARDLWLEGKIRLGGDVGKAEGGSIGSPDVIPAIALDLENEYQSYAAGGAAKMKLRKKSDQPAEEVSTPRPQLPQFGAGAPQEPSFTPEDPVQQMTVGSTNIPGQGGKFSKEDLADAFEKFRVLGGDYLRRGGPRGLPIDLALHLFGGKLPADVRELFGEGVPPESSFNPDELIEIEQKANGGPVHMQIGGQPPMDEIGYMMEAIDPTKESTGSPTFEAVKFMAPQIAKSLVSPFVGAYSTLTSGKYGTPEGIRAGEAAMERFMLPGEVNLSPEAEEKVMQAAKFMEELETKYKLPPLMPELFGPVTGAVQGMGPQARSLAGQGVAKAREAVSELPNLPVGLSIEAVGPGGKKLSVNDLIRMLEAGEEMTPEQRQKAEYSKAQKEKYAQANIARAQREPAPQEDLVKVPASDLGFFSSVEKAAANLKREEGSGDAFLSDIMRFNPSAGELEATGIVDFLKGKKSVTRQEVQDYIDQHSVQIEEVVRGTILDDVDRQKLNDINRRISRGFGYTITPEEEEWFEATRERLAQFKEPLFENENLILPNGKNYKEILLKFPIKKEEGDPYNVVRDQVLKPALIRTLGSVKAENALRRYKLLGNNPEWENDPDSKIAREAIQKLEKAGEKDALDRYFASFNVDIKNREAKERAYKTKHWPDDPNTFMHLRMQDMTIDGKKTLVIEEIQSDWHQEGRKKGYKQPGKEWEVFDPKDGKPIERFATEDEAKAYADKLGQSVDYAKAEGPPEAPFKKDWYQLGVKRLLKYAADNDYDQVALVGPDEQIRRGSLGTHIDGLIYEKNADGTIKLMAEKGQSVVLDKTVEPKDLDLYVGKDVAKRILDSKETDGTLTGDDLKIGGEGMRQYYGRNYPEYMNKLGRDYGTETKKTNFVIREYEPNDVEEVYTGEFDRYGREIIAYKVVDRETGEDIAFEYDFEKTLREANKKAPSTDMWLMDLPAKMKSDVKIGQPYKQGGAVKKRIGGPIYAPFNTKPDISDAGQLLDFGMEQELKRYG